MRIVILTHSEDRHYFFCNQIIEKTGDVVGVFTGAKSVNKSRFEDIKKTIEKRETITYVKNKFLNLVFKKDGDRFKVEKKQAEIKFFSGATQHFYENHKNLCVGTVSAKHRSINVQHYVSLIADLKPDIIVVMGTCLIGKAIISSAKHVVNIHTGLSPYYRGGRTNLWPFIENEYGRFGVTIHLMSQGIDSGNIIFTDRPSVFEDDDYATINCKCILLGTDLMVQAIKLIEKDEMKSREQWTKGKLFLNRDWNSQIANKYFQIRGVFLKEYCRLNENNALPKAKLIKNGLEV